MPASHAAEADLGVRAGSELLTHTRRVSDHLSEASLGMGFLGAKEEAAQTLLRLAELELLLRAELALAPLGHTKSLRARR